MVPGAHSPASTQILTTADLPEVRTDSRARRSAGAISRQSCDLLAVSAEHLREFGERHVAQQVADVAAFVTVLGELAVADLVHGGVVADDGDVGRAEPVGGLHVEGGHAEGAVTVVAQDFLLRVHQLGGEREARTHAQCPEGAGVHPIAGSPGLHRLGADGHHVAAVADVDGVLGEELVELPRHPVGMDGAGVGKEKRHELGRPLALQPAKMREPGRAAFGAVVRALPHRRMHRLHDRPRVAYQAQADVAVLGHRAVIHVDVDHGSVGAQPPAVAHAEVEGRAHDDDDVGLVEGVGAGAVEIVGIAGRQHATGGPVHVTGHVECLEQRRRGLVAAAGPHLGAQQHRRPLGPHQQLGQLLHVRGVADGLGRRTGAAALRHDGLVRRHLAVEHVPGNLQVARTRRSGKALPRGHGHHIGNALRGPHARRELGDGGGDVHVRQVLQRAHLVLRESALPADVKHRALRPERGGDAGQRVGEARPGGGHHAAQPPRLPGVSVRRMGRHLLVAHVDDTNAVVDAAVVDVDDMAAAQGEDGVHALVLERGGHQMSARHDTFWSRLLRANVSSAVLDVCLSVETLAMYAFPSP